MDPALPPDTEPDIREDADGTLRNFSRQFPEDFARAILPPRRSVTSASWIDPQVTARQRRLDSVLEVVADGERRLEHTEWQLEWKPDLPFRMFEYHVLLALAVSREGQGGQGPPPIRSTVVLLSGREKPWPAAGEYRTSPPGETFAGVPFGIDAVYQRTVAELEARASPLWLVFAPLAVDAGAEAMRRVVASLRSRCDEREFVELAGALMVMADTDKRRRGLRSVILPLLEKEVLMQSWLYKQGEAQGKANTLLQFLESRGLTIPEDGRRRILSCTDIAQLDAWTRRAFSATSLSTTRLDELLDGPQANGS